MKIQPYKRGLVRVKGDRYLPEELDSEIRQMAAYNNVSKRYVITTLIARALHNLRKEYDFTEANRKRTTGKGRNAKARRIK